jgi:hypothetical protein
MTKSQTELPASPKSANSENTPQPSESAPKARKTSLHPRVQLASKRLLHLRLNHPERFQVPGKKAK